MEKSEQVGTRILTFNQFFQMIEDSYSAGYNWCVDTIKMSSQHSQLSNDLEINKAQWITFEFGWLFDPLRMVSSSSCCVLETTE